MDLTDLQRDTFTRQLEVLGEDRVRDQLADGTWSPGGELRGLAADFLERRQSEREAAHRRTELLARRANFISWAAFIVAVGALIASLIALRG